VTAPGEPMPDQVIATVPPRGRLLRKYAVILAALVAGALVVAGAVQIWFAYGEQRDALLRIQREKATAAAATIEQFVAGIQGQLGWTTHAVAYAGPNGVEQRRFDFIRLLRQSPPITELFYIDADGKEQLRISRVAMDVVGSGIDRANEPYFAETKAQGAWHSPIYFHKESEPYMTIAAAEQGRSGGVTVAEVNLKFIWDVVSAIQVGHSGRAYVVDENGRLIAHPDISLVLRRTDLAALPQVAAALAGDSADEAITAPDPEGRQALSTHARIAPLSWLVFVDLPVAEAYQPLYASILRTSGLVLAGILIAALAGLLLARRMTGPIQRLQEGAARIGGGDLTDRIEIRTGDELEALAGEFNRMAARLHESHAGLEHKVEERTRDLAQARQRLIDAIESISEGFAFYDAEDRLQLRNERYQELLYGGMDIEIEPSTPFEVIVRRAVERGLIREAADNPERYIQERLAQHRNPGPPTLQHRADGRWILIAERRVTGGGTVAVYSDITELKQREMALEEANQRTREAAEEIGHKHRELEALSSKLAKYLSPQVYASIFEGRQEVKLASRRKKLTVFFSDIAGFTETTDTLESEDVTQLLNQYLTEMSRIALEYGATIDKYVGDAIMIFFGDPETRGVKEDALACVKMAIAMQARMQELAAIWRESGIEAPFCCRIGIHTGYCTVGNFGSEDRMDYTIIGGAVNLASRLEHEAPPGGILISYETYAHVQDEVRCEELGRIQVRGIGHPVATYRVVDLHESLSEAGEHFRVELPHLKLDLDPGQMSADERMQATARLKEALTCMWRVDRGKPSRRETRTEETSRSRRDAIRETSSV
jgi:class 3 adenylate cyclase/HAMP domain-containing protein